MICSRLLVLVLALSACWGATAFASGDDGSALPIGPGSYLAKNPDGTHPYGDSHGFEIGVDVEFLGVFGGLAYYATHPWYRPLGGGQKTYPDEVGYIDWYIGQEAAFGELTSASRPELTGELRPNDDGSFTADYTENGGNERVWHPE